MSALELRHGDCLDVLAVAARAGERYHAVVTDPPYHLTSIQKRFGEEGPAPAQHGRDGSFAQLTKGFMSKTWDGGDVSFRPETWRLVYDVLYPGAHMAVFGGTRTFHRMAVAIEDAGFEIRDCFQWLYATGFPKSANISRQIDKILGATGAVDPRGNPVARMIPGADQAKDGWAKTNGREYQPGEYISAAEEAAAWTGWGTALKPAHEPILLVRKPLEGTVARNVLTHGVGGLNIDGCRVGFEDGDTTTSAASAGAGSRIKASRVGFAPGLISAPHDQGRWPPNILHDGSPEVLEAFGRFGESKSTAQVRHNGAFKSVAKGAETPRDSHGFSDSGTAARFFPALGYTEEDYRFFYSSKANKAERMGSLHPTVKPIALLRWLARLITPSGGRILDPFAGTGTTGAAARAEGFDFTGIEMTDEYVEDCIRRLPEAAVDRGPWGLDLRDALARNRAAQEALRRALS